MPRKTTWQPAWKPSKRRDVVPSPIDTARPQENQRLETRHVSAEKRAFRARLPPIFTVGNLRKLPSSFITSQKMLRHSYHGIRTLSPPDAALTLRVAKNTQHDTSKVLRLPRQMTMDTSKVLRLPRKLQRIFWKRWKSIALATQNDFRHVTKNVWMSRHMWNLQKWPLLQNLP